MLHRAIDPEGRAHWLWSSPEGWRDLSLAGLAPGLASAAAWLVRPAVERERLLAQAPRLPSVEAWKFTLPGRPGKILALGRNFAAHAVEMGSEPSLDDMLWFAKFPEICVAPGAAVEVPAWLPGRIDPEAELVLVLAADLRNATEAEAQAAIAAWTLGNDLTARGVQAADKEKSWPWVRSKNPAGFGSYGPGWLPVEQLGDWNQLRLQGLVNGELRQEALLADMLYRPARALAELSRWLPLVAGDLLFLGTPSGVQALEDQDQLCVRLLDSAGKEPLGRLLNRIERASGLITEQTSD
jgi:2-keto-4-pentenoate hydratase/2-oxohepta-3-ene-1,7-dioic acid hydratase in catechol pathway